MDTKFWGSQNDHFFYSVASWFWLFSDFSKSEISVIKSLELFLSTQLDKTLEKVIILTFWQKFMKKWDYFDGSRRNRRSKMKKSTFIRGNYAHLCLKNGILTFSEKNVISSELAIIISALWTNECTFSRFQKTNIKHFRKIRLFHHKSVRNLDLI